MYAKREMPYTDPFRVYYFLLCVQPPAPAQPSPVKKPPPPPKSRSGGGDAKAEEEEDDEADKKEKKKKEKKEKKEKKKPPDRRSSARSAQSQVRLLAEHCFTLSDEAVQSLVRYRIPTQSKWDFKQKQHVRDETIKHLQRALDLLNQEKQRFKSACVDIETSLQDELTATKNNLAVAASGGGGGGGGGVVFRYNITSQSIEILHLWAATSCSEG